MRRWHAEAVLMQRRWRYDWVRHGRNWAIKSYRAGQRGRYEPPQPVPREEQEAERAWAVLAGTHDHCERWYCAVKAVCHCRPAGYRGYGRWRKSRPGQSCRCRTCRWRDWCRGDQRVVPRRWAWHKEVWD